MQDIKKAYPTAPGKHISTVKIGPKGQIVIPKEVREMFGVEPGDSLLLLADVDRGIAINTIEFFSRIADAAFNSSSPDKGETDFAQAVNCVSEGIENDSDKD